VLLFDCNFVNFRTSFVFELKPELVMELMAAAEYLQIPSLVSHIINMLAEYADGIFFVQQKIKKYKKIQKYKKYKNTKIHFFVSSFFLLLCVLINK
jgi:hypothetical protein